MVPLELDLKNFMSYGDEVTHLDLTHLHTVCLSGENGHGKSALLDAMTWALWGETRMGKQGHEQLIRIGADEMSVIFTFGLGSQRYRVRRQRSKRTAGQLWELQQDDGGGKWKPLTGVSSGDTGRTIQSLLRMSYDTFLNSAYLRQGRADEFVRQTAGRRKEILCEILDLGRYDALEERAKIKARDCASLAAEAQQRLNVIEHALADEPAFRAQLDDCLQRAAAIEAESLVIQAELDSKTGEQNQLMARQQHLQRLERDLAAIAEDLRRIAKDIEAERAEIASSEGLISRKADIVTDHEALIAARAASEELQQKVNAAGQLDRRRIVLSGEIGVERKRLENDLTAVDRELDNIARGQETFDRLTSELTQLAAKIAELDHGEAERNKIVDSELPEERDRMATLKTDRGQIDAKLAAERQRIENLAAQTELCSVCGTPLPPEKIAGITAQCRQEIAGLEAARNEVNAAGAKQKQLIDGLNARRESLDKMLAAGSRAREQKIRHEQDLIALESVRVLKPELEAEKAKYAEALASKSYAAPQIAELAQVESKLTALAGAAESLAEAAQTVRRLHGAEKQYHALAHAESAAESARRRVDAALVRSAELTARRTEIDTELASVADVATMIRALDTQLAELKLRRDRCTTDSQQAHAERGRIEAALQQLDQYRGEKAERERSCAEHRADEEIFKTLAGAFSKQGIQAVIIDSALPELEEDANLILDRISDGSLSIKILTTRKAKARPTETAPIETLEINIGDHLGTRPLELYSGGESFRVSFAIRIALSKLLARRAGANLQTLIIDEGFGTQDGKGREKLIEAINGIAHDFDKIIVITHIEELKEAFPARIEVVKTPMGSQITVTDGGYIG